MLTLSRNAAELRETFKNEFNPNDDVADLLILYEMTGFKLETERAEEFFERYAGEKKEAGDPDAPPKDPEEQFLNPSTLGSINPRASRP